MGRLLVKTNCWLILNKISVIHFNNNYLEKNEYKILNVKVIKISKKKCTLSLFKN